MISSDTQVIRDTQQELLELGFYRGKVDGVWGPVSRAALENKLAADKLRQGCNIPGSVQPAGSALAWGRKVSEAFRAKVRWIAGALEMPPEGADWLMSCMAWESGETFSPNIRNGAGSGAVGLIQFMPSTATSLGTTSAELAEMTAEAQLDFVYKYFRPYAGRLHSLSDIYMAILWPAAIGRPEKHVLWTKDAKPTTYRQNAGLDVDRNLEITKAEAASKVFSKLAKGLTPELRA